MMKLTKYFMLALPLLLASCSKVLDIAPNGRTSIDEIFADNDKTAAWLNACYANIPAKGNSYDSGVNTLTALCDDGYCTYSLNTVVARMYAGNATANTHPVRDEGDYYARYMSQLRTCTIFLQHIDGASVNLESDRRRWKAEALVLRSYFMLELLKWFGGYAYSPTGYSLTEDYTKITKRSVQELAEFISQDCSQALATEELPWRISESSDVVRVTKALAWAVQAEAALLAASPLHNEQADAGLWRKAFDVCSEAVKELESHDYALYRTVSDPATYTGPAAAWSELMSSLLPNSVDKETIWEGASSQYMTFLNYVGGLGPSKGGVCPTQELVDAFDVTNADRTVAEPLLILSKPYSAHEPNYNPAALALGYDPDDPYACTRDPRLEQTVVKNGDRIFYESAWHTIETFTGGVNGLDRTPTIDIYTRTGYYYRKFIKPGSDGTNHNVSPSWKYYRLARLKLDLAEAAVCSGHADVAEAQVNEVRSRVGMPPIPVNLSREELLLRVKAERRVELAAEECRYFDLRRWSGPEDDLKETCGTLTSMWITRQDDGSFTYQRKSDLTNLSTNNRDLLLPYPYAEATNLRALTKKNWQNPNW